jgi:hypothetical protein
MGGILLYHTLRNLLDLWIFTSKPRLMGWGNADSTDYNPFSALPAHFLGDYFA